MTPLDLSCDAAVELFEEVVRGRGVTLPEIPDVRPVQKRRVVQRGEAP